MIAQWEDKCISLSVLSVARVMIAQWENECISVSVLSVAWVQFSCGGEFQGIFPWLSTHTHTLQEKMCIAKLSIERMQRI